MRARPGSILLLLALNSHSNTQSGKEPARNPHKRILGGSAFLAHPYAAQWCGTVRRRASSCVPALQRRPLAHARSGTTPSACCGPGSAWSPRRRWGRGRGRGRWETFGSPADPQTRNTACPSPAQRGRKSRRLPSASPQPRARPWAGSASRRPGAGTSLWARLPGRADAEHAGDVLCPCSEKSRSLLFPTTKLVSLGLWVFF